MNKEQEQFPTKVDRNVYPEPEWRFKNSKIAITYKDSEPDFPPPKAAPENAPNILVVLLDDVGFGWPSVNGGLVEMPTAERIAANGLQYSQFHTTALCSPTRAALLTGRNHHTVSTGVIQESATGFPGYCGIIPKSCATVAELLKQNGYICGWWGKNHNVPDNQTSPAGPFNNWPNFMGFDYFYGFIGGETDQFYPALYRNLEAVKRPKTPEEGYHLTTDLTDDCIAWIRKQKSIAPDRPFFAYFATGAAHAPHQPPLSWRGRHEGKFDMGWDEYRKQVHQRQLDMDVIPKGTKLTKRPDQIPAWNDQNEEAKRLYARQAENYADFLEHTDYEVGRIVDALGSMKELDNTLVIYILGDNGSSAEGTLTGTPNELLCLNGMQPTFDEVMRHYDDWGKPGTSPHYAVGWAWAGDAPFQWTKQIASHFGGTRNGMVIQWPIRIEDKGGKRSQFHHCIDIAPTILEVVGISEPTSVNGIAQKPIEGVSMAYTFPRANVNAPSRRYQQYFEMFGNRAIYYDGWMASCFHGRLPWISSGSVSFENDVWELYNIAEDFSQSEDLTDKYPEKLRELQDLFMADAARYNVLPLDDRFAERLDVTLRPSFFYGRKHVVFYPGMVRLPEGSAPKTSSVSHLITVDAVIPKNGAEGVLTCIGGDTSGWTLYIEDRKLKYHYNYFDVERYDVVSSEDVPEGEVELQAQVICETPTPGGPATVKLFIDGKQVAKGKLDKQVPQRFGVESLDVGMDALSPVNKAYKTKGAFEFTGEIRSVTYDFDKKAVEMTAQERLRMHVGMD